jgi:hypothetical protein
VFEEIKDYIYENTEKVSRPIVDALFSEMTVLGFLSMVTFIVAGAGVINDISAVVFGSSEEGKGYLKELFEQAHYMLFLVSATPLARATARTGPALLKGGRAGSAHASGVCALHYVLCFWT